MASKGRGIPPTHLSQNGYGPTAAALAAIFFLPRAEFGFAILCAFTVALKPTLSFLNADQFALYSAPHSLFFDFLQCLNRVLILDAGGAIIGEDVA